MAQVLHRPCKPITDVLSASFPIVRLQKQHPNSIQTASKQHPNSIQTAPGQQIYWRCHDEGQTRDWSFGFDEAVAI
jgi:hypothetical protein